VGREEKGEEGGKEKRKEGGQPPHSTNPGYDPVSNY